MMKAFSLLELLITLAILSFILSVSSPHLTELHYRQQTYNTLNLLHSSLQLARMTAVSTGVPTILVPSNGDWSLGWLIFASPDTASINPGHSRIISRTSAQPVKILFSQTLRTRIVFLPNGQAVVPSGGFQAGTFTICDNHSKRSYQLVINRVGRVRRSVQPATRVCSN